MERLDRVLENVASLAVAEGAADGVYTEVTTPIGKLFVVVGPSGICRIAFAEEPEDLVLMEVASVRGPRLLRSKSETKLALDALDAYFDHGDPGRVPVDLSLVRSPFRKLVLEHLRRVPTGEVTTYGDLAAAAGHPRAARAAGTTCATNPIPVVVPCHRVIPASGGIGKYGGGVERKRWLLEFEARLN